MGLDMYLTREFHLYGKELDNLELSGIDELDPKKISRVVEDFGYWRKANQIHNWFVKNVQGGEDNCREYEVSREQLKELLDTVNTVIKSCELVEGEIKNGSTFKNGVETPNMIKGKYIKDPKVAKELLPTSEGFFFGGIEYDEYYYQDLIHTKEILERAVASKNGYFSYHSSW
jgi:hypothetical protein